jgi:actin-related protein
MSDLEAVETVVIDNGSGACKAGFAGEEAPGTVVPSVIGRPFHRHVQVFGSDAKDAFVGDNACAKAGILSLKYPVEHGIVTNWDDMEKIWFEVWYGKLHVDPAEHPVLLTEPALNPKPQREKAMQIQFENFNVSSFCFASQGYLPLLASGGTTGLVLEIGDGLTQIVPVYESHVIDRSTRRLQFGGRDLTEWLERLVLIESGFAFSGSPEREIVRDIKEKLCYVAPDFDQEAQKKRADLEVPYTLPDGRAIGIGSERFYCPELLFSPSLFGLRVDPVHRAVVDSITHCDVDVRKDLFGNIVLSGGTTMFNGFPERFAREVRRIAGEATLKVIARPERKCAVWLGGSVFGSLPTFLQMAITHEEYNDAGSAIVHKKCPR